MGGDGATQTLSLADDARNAEDTRACPHLFLALEAHRAAAPPARLALADIDEVIVGRGAARRIEAATAGGARRLLIRVEDPWMSSEHARFTRAMGRWLLEDTGSKNGSLIDGRPARRAELEDGALIELGHTFFLFRRSLPAEPSAPAVLDLGERGPPLAPGMATLSPTLAGELARLPALARSGVPIIVTGETGTGKEVTARALHALSGRRGSFVAVNCGALPAPLVEGQLFGHRRGAFSGATEDSPGLVRAADGGTLLLDEIGDMPAPAQAALLRVLEQREVLPLGGTRPIPVDLRVIATTHRPLEEMVEAGTFRRDLHARLAGYHVALPPLRDRREDIGLLAGELLARAAPAAGGAAYQPRAARALLCFDWPGNVRQLERCLSAAVALAGGGPIALEHLPAELRGALERPRAAPDLDGEDAAQRERLVALLREHRGNVSAVARALGKARMQVQRWLKRYGLMPESFH